jgi:hypothetical protein
VSSATCLLAVFFPAALKADFLLPDLEDAIRQFDIELLQFGPNLQDVSPAHIMYCQSWAGLHNILTCRRVMAQKGQIESWLELKRLLS